MGQGGPALSPDHGNEPEGLAPRQEGREKVLPALAHDFQRVGEAAILALVHGRDVLHLALHSQRKFCRGCMNHKLPACLERDDALLRVAKDAAVEADVVLKDVEPALMQDPPLERADIVLQDLLCVANVHSVSIF